MRIVSLEDGRLELRWTWLPFWIAAGSVLQGELEALMRDAVIMNGLRPGDEALAAIDAFVRQQIERRFQIPGLGQYLAAIEHVEM